MDIDPQYPVVSDKARAAMLKAREELLAEGWLRRRLRRRR